MSVTIRFFCLLLIMTAFFTSPSMALELYVDKDTQQVYAAPGKNRVKLGEFERKQDIEELEAKLRAEIEEEFSLKYGIVNERQSSDKQNDTVLADSRTTDDSRTKTALKENKSASDANISYGQNGFTFSTDNENFSLAIQNRIQARFATPFDSDPRTLDDLQRDQNSFMIRRARTKLRGHAYVPWLKYYLQYDWAQPVLRDLNLTIDKYKWAQVRIGRGKVSYNNERVTSSGKQQFVNRSIVNDIFTVDRQQGIEVKGNLFPSAWHDITYYAGVFTGLGVGERNNDDDNLMYSGRLQWNALGGEMTFSQSDLTFHEQPALNISIAANTNTSRCTAFETDNRSCRRLTDVDTNGVAKYRDPSTDAQNGQYKIDQIMGEIQFKWQGFSFLHELHSKKIKDTLNNDEETTLLGGFVQAGFFPHYHMEFLSPQVELAARYAFVDMNTDRSSDKQTELSTVINYFLDGHSSKISLQLSHLTLQDPILLKEDSENRLWAQWDFSF